ncbi:hypothetical protein EUGRSUZ_L02471 [Eucalyptus grandis]|uniref:Uncharacterized protein n=1 Tax=Eucalyptus grandis TaxID=71139 RepID=A0A058ZQR6_EUCGR|nr:hypothetical protein EUGRSUZ_L02471 [Eucalyptus grandis]
METALEFTAESLLCSCRCDEQQNHQFALEVLDSKGELKPRQWRWRHRSCKCIRDQPLCNFPTDDAKPVAI